MTRAGKTARRVTSFLAESKDGLCLIAAVAFVTIAIVVIADVRRNNEIENVRSSYNELVHQMERHNGAEACKKMTPRYQRRILAIVSGAEPELVEQGCAATFDVIGAGIFNKIENLRPGIAVNLHGDCAHFLFPKPKNQPFSMRKIDGKWLLDDYIFCQYVKVTR